MKKNLVFWSLIRTTLLGALIAFLVIGCSKSLSTNTDSLYVPSETDVTSTATLADLQAGRSLFIANCGKCHTLYSPDAFSVANWKTIVPNMAAKAGINSTQVAQIVKYVTRGK